MPVYPLSIFPPPTPNAIALITGASYGMGRDVALLLAASGWRVLALARSNDKLQELAKQQANIQPLQADVTDANALHKVIAEIKEPIELCILNAGSYRPQDGKNFSADNMSFHLQLNVLGVAQTLEPIWAAMRGRGRGHVAVVASVAGYRGLPRASGYGASKAALINLCESLYLDGKALGIKVQVICPGFVKTPLTDKNEFPMPFLISSEEAAQRIVKGLAGKDFEIHFPKRFTFILKMLRLLPYPLYFWLLEQGYKKMMPQGQTHHE